MVLILSSKQRNKHPDSAFAGKTVADTDISNQDTTLSSYALTNTDPFFTNGIQVGLFNNSG